MNDDERTGSTQSTGFPEIVGGVESGEQTVERPIVGKRAPQQRKQRLPPIVVKPKPTRAAPDAPPKQEEHEPVRKRRWKLL